MPEMKVECNQTCEPVTITLGDGTAVKIEAVWNKRGEWTELEVAFGDDGGSYNHVFWWNGCRLLKREE